MINEPKMRVRAEQPDVAAEDRDSEQVGTGEPESDLPSGLAKPAQRALAAAGIVRLEQFTQRREADVLMLHGMGPKALNQIRQALAAKGMSFAVGAHDVR